MSIRTKLIGVLSTAVMVAGFVGMPAAHATGVEVVGVGPLSIETNANSYALGLDGTSLIGDFTGVTLNGAPQLTTATITSFTVVDADGSGAGWLLTLDVPIFDGAGGHAAGHNIPAAGVGMDAPVVLDAQTGAARAWGLGSPIGTGFNGGVDIVTSLANANSMGTFTVSPLPLRLLVPVQTYDGTYTSVATLTLASQ